MGSSWKHDPIADHVSVSQGLAINKGSKHLLEETGLPLLRITDLINKSASQFVNAEKVPKKCVAQPNELIFTRTGQVGLVFRNRTGVVHNNCFKVIPKETVDVGFLYWFLFQDTVKDYVNSVASGSVQKDLNHAAFFTLEIPVPPLAEQKAIAHILDTLDDKIELNRRMNATLEGMAQALFKSWFVDFDPVIDNALAAGNPIPDELAPRAEARKNALANGTTQQGSLDHPTLLGPESFPAAFEFNDELGWIPEGWEAKKIEDCISRFSAGKKYSQKTAEDGGCVPILDQGKSGIIGYHNDEPGVKASTDDPIIVFANHTCYMRLIQFDFSAIQNVLPYKGNGLNIYWIYEATKGRQDFIEYKGHWPDFVLNRIVVPSIDLVDVFGDVVEASYRKIYANTLENEGLTKLRDTLLPQLISGELRITEGKQLTKEALA